jgi:hypothetical protein
MIADVDAAALGDPGRRRRHGTLAIGCSGLLLAKDRPERGAAHALPAARKFAVSATNKADLPEVLTYCRARA